MVLYVRITLFVIARYRHQPVHIKLTVVDSIPVIGTNYIILSIIWLLLFQKIYHYWRHQRFSS